MTQMKSLAIGAAPVHYAGAPAWAAVAMTTPVRSAMCDALVILQRPKRNDAGDIFQYTSYIPGARLIKLSPPTADGTITHDLLRQGRAPSSRRSTSRATTSPSAQQVDRVRRAHCLRRPGVRPCSCWCRSPTAACTWSLIASDPGRDYVTPIFLPGDQILFTSNDVVSSRVTDPDPEAVPRRVRARHDHADGHHQYRRDRRAARPA